MQPQRSEDENTTTEGVNDDDQGSVQITCFEQNLEKIKNRNKSDSAFMGFTHSISAIALSLTLIAFFSTTVALVLGTSNPWVFIMVTLVAAGFALVPDLDNSASTVKSAFGIVGSALSVVFRSSALVVQTVIRKKADDANPDPHRGFWHTIPASLLIGAIVYGITRISGTVTLPWLGEFPTGTALGFLVAFCAMHLMFAGVFKSTVKKVKKLGGPLGSLLAFFMSATTTVVLMANIPSELDMWWLGVACAFGCIAHILGDMFTKAGVPIFWPIIGLWKKKMWWKTRFPLNVEAGGDFESKILAPLFILVIVGMSIKILVGGM